MGSMATTTQSQAYKPSPLSFGSPRASPFRRPESPSPSSPSTTIRPSTPTIQSTRPQTPSRLSNASNPVSDAWAPLVLGNQQSTAARELPVSPTKSTNGHNGRLNASPAPAPLMPRTASSTTTTLRPNHAPAQSIDLLSKLPSAQVREMREAFSLLDRSSTGSVTREDVAHMLASLGLPTDNASLTPYFSPATMHPLALPTFLSTLSTLLVPLSAPAELLAALSAFDDDDSGQVDAADLADALLHTAPEPGTRPLTRAEIDSVMGEFKGKRAFGGSLGRMRGQAGAEVFRYREWVAGMGAVGAGEGEKAA